MINMDFNNYQFRAAKTAIYPKEGLQGLLYTSLGLVSEAGEVAGKVKKILRDDQSVISPDRHEQLVDEIGDVLWYCAMFADELGITLGYAAMRNIDKLEDRMNRGKIQGSGDNRQLLHDYSSYGILYLLMVTSKKKLIKEVSRLEKKLRETESKLLAIRVQYILIRADRNRLKEELGEENREGRDKA